MKKTLLALIACVSAAAALTALTPEETLDRRGIGDLDFAPDGHSIRIRLEAHQGEEDDVFQ